MQFHGIQCFCKTVVTVWISIFRDFPFVTATTKNLLTERLFSRSCDNTPGIIQHHPVTEFVLKFKDCLLNSTKRCICVFILAKMLSYVHLQTVRVCVYSKNLCAQTCSDDISCC